MLVVILVGECPAVTGLVSPQARDAALGTGAAMLAERGRAQGLPAGRRPRAGGASACVKRSWVCGTLRTGSKCFLLLLWY